NDVLPEAAGPPLGCSLQRIRPRSRGARIGIPLSRRATRSAPAVSKAVPRCVGDRGKPAEALGDRGLHLPEVRGPGAGGRVHGPPSLKVTWDEQHALRRLTLHVSAQAWR